MFSDPQNIVLQLPIPPGAVVADLGAGVGAYSIPLAKKIGTDGKVYACDVQADMLVRIENEARTQSITNIQAVHSNIENHLGTKLRDASVDWVIAANVLFQVEDRPGFVAEIVRILKPGGHAVIIDWTDSFSNLGPHAKDVVSKDEASKLCGESGLQVVPNTINAGEHHYALLLKK